MKKIHQNEIIKEIMNSKKYQDALNRYLDDLDNSSNEAFRNTIRTRIRRFNKLLNDIETTSNNDERMKTMISIISSLPSTDLAKFFFIPLSKSSSPSKEGDDTDFVRRTINKDLFDFKEARYRILDDFDLNVDPDVITIKTKDEQLKALIDDFRSTDNPFYKEHLRFVFTYLYNIRYTFKNPLFIKEQFPPMNKCTSEIYLSIILEYLNLIENYLSQDPDYLSYIFSPYDYFSDLLFNSSDELIFNFCKIIDLICFNDPSSFKQFKDRYYYIKNIIKNDIEKLKGYDNICDDLTFNHLEIYIDRVDRNNIFDKFSFLCKEIKNEEEKKELNKNEKKERKKKNNNKYKYFSAHYYSSDQSFINDNNYKTFIKNLNQIKKFINLFPFNNLIHNNPAIPCINLLIQNKDSTFEKIMCKEFYILDQEHKVLKIHKDPSYNCSTLKLIQMINEILENKDKSSKFDLFFTNENHILLNEDNTIKYVYHLLFTEKIRRGYYREYLNNDLYTETFELRQDFNKLIEEIFSFFSYDVKFKLITILNNELNGIYDFFSRLALNS